jgi:hypothetical protein
VDIRPACVKRRRSSSPTVSKAPSVPAGPLGAFRLPGHLAVRTVRRLAWQCCAWPRKAASRDW